MFRPGFVLRYAAFITQYLRVRNGTQILVNILCVTPVILDCAVGSWESTGWMTEESGFYSRQGQEIFLSITSGSHNGYRWRQGREADHYRG
jgi:hypothetical protein